MLDILVAEVMLDSSRVLSGLRQFVAAGMAQHVWMHWKWQLSLLPCPANYLAKGIRR